MKLPKSVSKMLENKYVLYFVLFLAVTNLFGYLILGNFTAIIFFILVGYLVSIFSKNMIVVLSVPLIFTSILMVGKKVKEGMEDATKEQIKDELLNKKEEKEKNIGVKLTNAQTLQTNVANAKATYASNSDSESLPIVPSETTETTETTTEPTSSESMANINNKRRNRIDYAATVEDAYDDLNKILGGDGIKRLTDDTQKLMGQQLQLADAMKSMSPLLEQAKSMLQGFDLKNLDGIASFAKNFGGSASV